MLRLADVIEDVCLGNPLLQFGLQHRLLNLSQVAAYIQPLLEVKAKKEVQTQTILMALSRLQKRMKKTSTEREDFRIKHLFIQSNLITNTFAKTPAIHSAAQEVYAQIQAKKGFIAISESIGEITLITEDQYESLIHDLIKAKPKFSHSHLSSIGVTFDEKYTTIPGFIYIILQQLLLLHINVIEITSTFTEIVLYIDEKDTKMAFEALHRLFVRK